MVNIITAPDNFNPLARTYDVNVFLAGGITGCPNWQPEFLKSIKNYDVNIFNPRRANWDTENDASIQQIEWEFHHLALSNIIVFWFPQESICPITLLEYGKFLVSNKILIVGVHPNYPRKLDVVEQTRLERPYQSICVGFDELVRVTRRYLGD